MRIFLVSLSMKRKQNGYKDDCENWSEILMGPTDPQSII